MLESAILKVFNRDALWQILYDTMQIFGGRSFFSTAPLERNNTVLSSVGIPQFAAIMGNCIAGEGYLPVLCDQLLMTEGSGLYLAGPALVKAAIGQVTDSEELGGAKMHAELSGTVDYVTKDDQDCLERLRYLVGMLPEQEKIMGQEST